MREAFVIMLLIWAFRWSKGIETPGSCSLLCLARAFGIGVLYLMDGSKRAFDHLVGMRTRAQVQRCGRRARLEKICRIFRSRKATMRHAFHVHQKFRATDLKMGYMYLGGLGHLCGLWLEFRPESLRCLGRSGFAPACPAGSTIHQHTTQLSDMGPGGEGWGPAFPFRIRISVEQPDRAWIIHSFCIDTL